MGALWPQRRLSALFFPRNKQVQRQSPIPEEHPDTEQHEHVDDLKTVTNKMNFLKNNS